MAQKIKVGIIGYGWVATAHIAALNHTTHAEVTAVYSSRALDSAELSQKWGGTVTAYNDLDALLASDIDAVSICSYPYQQHASTADEGRESRQTSDPRKTRRALAEGLRRHRESRRAGQSPHVRLFRMPFLQPIPGDQSRRSTAACSERSALRGSGLLSRHRTLVRAVPLEHRQGARRQRAAHRGLPCAGCAAALHGQRRERSRAFPRAQRAPSSTRTNTTPLA